MENYIEIDTGVLQGDIGTMNSNVRELRQRISELEGEEAELSSMWIGAANAAFRKQFAVDMEFMKEVAETVDKLIACMEFAKKEYDKCENEVGDLIASIRI